MIRQCCNATGKCCPVNLCQESGNWLLFSRIKVEKGSHKAFEIVMDADKFRYFNESGAKIYKSKILLMDSGKIIFEE